MGCLGVLGGCRNITVIVVFTSGVANGGDGGSCSRAQQARGAKLPQQNIL